MKAVKATRRRPQPRHDNRVGTNCHCNGDGYCPVHGTFTPQQIDPEVMELFEQAQMIRVARAVVRKPIDS